MNLTSQSQCTACTAGHYCGSAGLTSPSGLCKAGYFCGRGSSVATPHESSSPYTISYAGETCVSLKDTTVNDVCPEGHYCPEGSGSPIQCPQGRNSSSTGLRAVSDCPLCRAGYYCPLNGTIFATRLCPAGYWCPSGTIDPSNNTTLICPQGHYCPEGSPEPISCAAGSYEDQQGQAVCKACPSGCYCLSCLVSILLSSRQLLSMSHNEYLCPNGTFSDRMNLTSQAQCTACTAEHYCMS